MIKSMTGFGKGEAATSDKRFRVEIRSVNSKQLDLNIKAPGRYREAESQMRAILSQTLKRGKVDCFVQVESTLAETSNHINEAIFKAYAEAFRSACLKSDLKPQEGDLLQAIMRMPDVLTTSEEAVSEQELQAICEATAKAAEQLDRFRIEEGRVLIADLLERVDKIEAYKVAVEPYEQARTEHIKNRIREHIQEVGIPIDSARLEQEMIFYVEKLDITEEKVRLKQHCDYFREVAQQEQEPGRKLGFIAQEMGREINTMGSKSNEAEMQILVVKMKDELEKIKEQVLNIL